MGEYTLTLARSASKELESLPDELVRRIWPRIKNLKANPRPPGCRKLSGERNLWRIRIGDYRVIYSVDDSRQIVDVTAVRNRKDAYR